MFKLITFAATALLPAAPALADTFTVTFDQSIRAEPATGRIVLFFITETGRGWDRRRPMDGPFFSSPQPIASIAVEKLQPGEPAVFEGSEAAFPEPLDRMHGRVRVQAVLDLADNPERSHTDGPGNLFSDVVTVELSRDAKEHVALTLSHVIAPRSLPDERENLKWIELRSDLLSDFYGRDVYHRAGVALPPQYLQERSTRENWPAIYVVPGYGGRHTMARSYAGMYRHMRDGDEIPIAVTIVLDPESPLGHHGFVDSPNHGPRGTALVTELLPHLEQRFNLVAEPEARIITGHSSGGWTSLWLQLNWPEVFGACFASAPDAIDFSAFQKTDLYSDENLYVMADGTPTPSYRDPVTAEAEHVAMTVQQECQMEYAMHPLGGSGQQWDAWQAMFSPRDETTGFPARMFDALTGDINREIIQHWKQYDITRMARADWDRLGPIITQRVRLACGELDNYYLQRAVQRFKAMVQEHVGDNEHSGDGYILLVEHASHGSLGGAIYQRWSREMREHLQRHGLHD